MVASVLNGVAIVGGDVVASSFQVPVQGIGIAGLLCLSVKLEVFDNGSLIQPCTWAMELRSSSHTMSFRVCDF